MQQNIEHNNCTHCGTKLKFIPSQGLITKVLCTSCNKYSHFNYVTNSK